MTSKVKKQISAKKTLANLANGHVICYLMRRGKYYCSECASENSGRILVLKYLWYDEAKDERCDCCKKLFIGRSGGNS